MDYAETAKVTSVETPSVIVNRILHTLFISGCIGIGCNETTVLTHARAMVWVIRKELMQRTEPRFISLSPQCEVVYRC